MSGRFVFVGNLPYDADEDTLVKFFCQAGPVIKFRLIYDKDTGKPKGFGYCEYLEASSVLSACRILNGREFNGRTLRVEVDRYTDIEAALGQPREEDLAPEPPAKKRRIDEVLRDFQQVELTLGEIAQLPSPVGEALMQLAQVLNAAEKNPPQPTFTTANVARNVTTSERLYPSGMK